VLDLAKGDAGRLTVTRSPGRAQDVVDAALAIVQPAAALRAIRLSSMEDPGGAPNTYYGDEDRVRQILVNLLTNAVKFTPAGGSVEVRFGRVDRLDQAPASLAGPLIYISVADTGSGIAPEDLARIFDPFVQVHGGHTRTADGSGLGLSVSRRLAHLMEGEVTVRSDVGKGSAFTLWLPAAVEGSDGPRDEHESRPPAERTRLLGLTQIGYALHREVDAVLEAFVERLRGDAFIPAARALPFPQLADHLSSYVTTVGTSLMAVEAGQGQPSGLVADGSDILRTLADRHGAQRQRLGWTAPALEREWQLLAEELHRAMGRSASPLSESTLTEAGAIVDRYLEYARETSLRSFARAASK
jgi:hypothetical protein